MLQADLQTSPIFAQLLYALLIALDHLVAPLRVRYGLSRAALTQSRLVRINVLDTLTLFRLARSAEQLIDGDAKE